MKLYAVRRRGDHRAVGLFWAGSMDALIDMVDEHDGPDLCEYKVIDKMAAILFETDDGEVVGWKLGTKDGPLANVDEGDDSGDAFKERLATVRGTVKFGISDPDELGDFLLGKRDIKGWKTLDVDGWLERETGATTPEQKQAVRDRLFGRPIDESKRGPRAPVVKLSDRRKPKGDDDVH